MKRFLLLALVASAASLASASWYWPFGSDDDDDSDQPRVSKLLEPASVLIDEASDAAEDGNVTNAVALYRRALKELGRIEAENPERAKTPAFTSLRSKRAYVNAAIDALLLGEAHENAKAVVVTDTTDLERQFAARRQEKKGPSAQAKSGVVQTASQPAPTPPPKTAEGDPAPILSRRARIEAALGRHPDNRKLRLLLIGEKISAKEYESANADIRAFLAENPGDLAALNLAAACAHAEGDPELAAAMLDEVIAKAPNDYNAYYNMASLKLENGGEKDDARHYYETGRKLGGPKDPDLEERLK